ncbi:MAG: DUF177 domain-containing protein [Pseudomonadota bacterium]
MQAQPHNSPTEPLRPAEIRSKKGIPFEIELGKSDLDELIARLDLVKLSKVRFEGRLSPEGGSDIELTATLGATAVQACVVTLAPVSTRIDAKLTRTFTEIEPAADSASEFEFSEDDPEDALPGEFVLLDLLTEALAMELPVYPKAEGAELEQSNFAEPGVEPMTDEDARPFAGLAALKEKLSNPDNGS